MPPSPSQPPTTPITTTTNRSSYNIQDIGLSPCPKCGRKSGRLKIIREKINVKYKSPDRSQLPTEKTVVVGHDTSNKPIKNKSAIQRNIHPFRHISTLTHYAANTIYGKITNDVPVVVPTNPSINPPVSNNPNQRPTSDAENRFKAAWDESLKKDRLIVKMIPKIAEKLAATDPNLFKSFNDICKKLIPYIEFDTKYWKSGVDYRYKRSLPEWNEIVKYANEKSPRAAAKKYYGIKPDGKKVYLSINEIKQKQKEMENFEREYMEHYYVLNTARMALSQIIASDPELQREYEKMKLEYDDDNDDDDNLNQKNNSSSYTYNYFKIAHYDHDLYKKRKKLGKSKPDGRIECRIEKSKIPQHIMDKFIHSKS